MFASVPEVGKKFRINRYVIEENQKEIRYKCEKEGYEGERLWHRLKWSTKIAYKNFDQYPSLIDTYIFEKAKEYKTVQQIKEMCNDWGYRMCDEVICDLELQMRICNGEAVGDLLRKPDKLPVRLIILRNGGVGYFGGRYSSATNIDRYYYIGKYCLDTPYGFCPATEH